MALGVWVVDIGLPGGTVKYGAAGFGSLTGGSYSPRVLSWGSLDRQVSDRGGTIAAAETSFDLADTDRVFARVTEGALRESVVGSTVVIKHADPLLASSSWYTGFTGVLAKWLWPEPMRASIVARTDDLALRRKVPRSTWLLGPADWPNILAEAVGKYASIVYGSQDSGPYNKTGMVECHCVNTSTFQYVVAAGLVNVGQVYADGVAAGFGQKTEFRGGKTFTTVIMAADQGVKRLTADVYGYDCVTPGGGSMTTNPALILAHFLSNFCFGDWQTGAWLSTSARIDATYLAAAVTDFTARGVRGGRVVSDASNGYDQIREWLQTFEYKGWWTGLGALAFRAEDPTDTGIYVASPRAINEADWSEAYDDQAVVTDLVANYNYQPVESQYMSTVNPSKPKIYSEAPEILSMNWLAVE
jgi:hypothetical protein